MNDACRSAPPLPRRRALAWVLPWPVLLSACASVSRPPAPIQSRPVAPAPRAPGAPAAAMPAPASPAAGPAAATAPGAVSQGVSPVGSDPLTGAGAAPAAAPSAALAAEERWLRELFGGTPVQIAAEADGSVAIAVPMEFSFDRGGAAVKPPLAALLDRLVASLRRQPRARLQLAAPGDVGLPVSLSQDRVTAQRDHLLKAGIPYNRTVPLGRSRSEAVELRLLPPPAPTPAPAVPMMGGSTPP